MANHHPEPKAKNERRPIAKVVPPDYFLVIQRLSIQGFHESFLVDRGHVFADHFTEDKSDRSTRLQLFGIRRELTAPRFSLVRRQLNRTEKGWVLEDDKRIVTFRIKTFQAFTDRLISLVGGRLGETILYHVGNEIGHVAFDYSRANVKSEDALGPVLDNVLAERGWGRCIGFQKQTHDEKVTYVLRAIGTPSSHERKSTQPQCHIVRGIVSGYVEGYLGKKAQSHLERECVSTGSQYCVFETTFTQ